MKNGNIADFLIDEKHQLCNRCNSIMQYTSGGTYECGCCGNIVLDDFGIVKEYIDINGPTPAFILAKVTGVSLAKINMFLRYGRVEIPEGSDIFCKCETCNTDIRYGRFCPACAKSFAGDMQQAFLKEEVGEVPKYKNTGKMRFIENK